MKSRYILKLLCIACALLCSHAFGKVLKLEVPSLDVIEGRIAKMTMAPEAEWKAFPKLDVIFVERRGENIQKPVAFSGRVSVIPLSAGGDLSAVPDWEVHGASSLGDERKGVFVHMMRFLIAPPDYSGTGVRFVSCGQGYRIWNERHGKASIFTVPSEIGNNNDVTVIWDLSEGLPSGPYENKAVSDLIAIEGRISKKVMNNEEKLIVHYFDASGEVVSGDLKNRSFSLSVKSLGGELRIGPARTGHALFIEESVRQVSFTFPEDADCYYPPEERLPCSFKVQGSSGAVDQVRSIGLYLNKTSEAYVTGAKLRDDNGELHDFWKNPEFCFDVSPGRYWVRIYGGVNGTVVVGESSVEVKKDPSGNIFILKVGQEGHGVTTINDESD